MASDLTDLLCVTDRDAQKRRQRAQLRMDICVKCEAYTPKQMSSVCSDCGCILQHKVERAGDTCPRNKWPTD